MGLSGLVTPFQGSGLGRVFLPQGVALGFLVGAPSGRQRRPSHPREGASVPDLKGAGQGCPAPEWSIAHK